MKLFSFHIVLAAVYIAESDGLSVINAVPNITTAIVVPPDSSSVTLSWNYTLNSGEQLLLITVGRTRRAENQDLVSYLSSNPSSNGVKEQFKSRMNFSVSGDEFHLVINNLVVNDGNGFSYKCQVITVQGSSKSALVLLVVRVAAHNVAVECNDAVLDQAMTCTCTADGDPAPISFEWRASNGSFLGNGSSYTTPSVERSLNGSYYTCVVSNGFGPNSTKNSSIFYVKEKPSSVEISPPPCVTVNETDNTTLKCKASGGIPAVYYYKWQHNGNYISGGENGTLTLIEVQRNQSGNYSCQGCNTFGCTKSDSTCLIVRYNPDGVRISPHPLVTVNEKGQTTLTCQASGGNPTLYQYKWKYEGNDIDGEQNTTLHLDNVQRNQSGNYSCLGCNMIGCTSNTTFVIVQYQPFNVSIVADPDSAVAAGKPLTLICTFDSGNLPISVEWKLNNAPMLQQTDRSLVIQKVGISDRGTYECTAKNVLGKATGKINITVTSDVCGEKSCSGNGDCTIQNGVKKCKCKDRWHGEDCSACTCNSVGTTKGGCEVVKGEPFCDCNDKYIGDLCELPAVKYEIKVAGQCILTNYTYEAEMENIDSNQSKEFIAFFRPLFKKGTLAKACKITRLTKGSVKIHFELFFDQGTIEQNKEAVKNFTEGGKLGNYSFKKDSLDFEDTSGSDPTVTKGISTETIVIIVVAVVTLVMFIITVVVWRVKKNRCRRKRKVANGKELKLGERHLSNPSIIPGSGSYSNPALEHTPYAEDGPTVTSPQDERSRKGEKPVALYAEVDMSKKSKNKKPGEVLYADLATFQPNVATENSNAQQPVKKPEKHQSTDYAHITDVFEERGGKSVKVPIAASNRNITNNGSTMSEP